MKEHFRLSGKYVFALNLFGLAVLCLVLSPLVFGQTSGTGALSGTVKDASGAVVPNATVTITDRGTNQTRTATTGSDGAYKFGFLPPGDYSLSVEATGFKSAMVGSLTITVTETAVVDETLQVGAQSQQIEVSAEGETAVQTTGAAQGTVLNSQTVTDMPLTVRNYSSLLGLSAGANATVANAGSFGRGTQDCDQRPFHRTEQLLDGWRLGGESWWKWNHGGRGWKRGNGCREPGCHPGVQDPDLSLRRRLWTQPRRQRECGD
jgi:hypothetical protein